MTDFVRTIEDLFRRLALGRPSFRDERYVDLVVDGITVTLREAPDERGLVLTARAGRLAADRPQADRQIRRILGIAAGLMTTNGAAVMLDTDAPDPKPVLVRNRHVYAPSGTDRLVEAIQDVLQAVEIVGPELQTSAVRPVAVAAARDNLSLSDIMIFRP
jgi:hypothetical protein